MKLKLLKNQDPISYLKQVSGIKMFSIKMVYDKISGINSCRMMAFI